MVTSQIIAKYSQCPGEESARLHRLALRPGRFSKVVQDHCGIQIVRTVRRFYDLECSKIMLPGIIQTAEIAKPLSQDERSQSHLRVTGAEKGLINLQRSLEMQKCIFYVSLGDKHPSQVVQAYGNVGMV